MGRPSLSVIVPALNEEGNLGATLHSLSELLPQYFLDWEILVFNDGSTDRTGAIADEWGKRDHRVRVFHHSESKNLGGCYQRGVRFASKDHLLLVPGDGECGPDLLAKVFLQIGSADILIPFPTNPSIRPVLRQCLSSTFVRMLNLLSRLNIKYYNGTVVHRTEIARKYFPKSSGFDYQAEVLVRALRAGCSYQQIPVELSPRRDGKSKALRLKNWVAVGRFLARIALKPLT